MAFVKTHEEGAETCAAYERTAREDQGDEENRPASQRIAGGTDAFDEGGQSTRRLLAASDSDAVSLRALSCDHHLDRFQTSTVFMDQRFIGSRANDDSYSAAPDGRINDGLTVVYTRAIRRPDATQVNGYRDAALNAVDVVERACWLACLFVGWEPRGVWSTVHHQSFD